MRRRLLLTLCCLVGLALAGLVVLELLAMRPGVSYANYQRIRNGMTLKEVEELMGKPALIDNERRWLAMWRSENAIIFIACDWDDRVADKEWSGATFWTKLRGCLGL